MTFTEGASEQREQLGRSYTKARRYPWMIGKIQGWVVPFGPFTALQIGVLVTTLWLLLQTAPWWTRLGFFAVIPLAVPFAATWAVRHAHIDGRSPLHALAGYLALATAPRQGTIRGRPTTSTLPRPTRLTGVITIQADPTTNDTPDEDTGPIQGAARPHPTTLRDLLATIADDTGDTDEGE
ncbi:conjugal transfer protein [Nocardiopsis dassonvillei]|uniref:conjugal transfer protein n=1 Tax=Nocardiopsis dassonvillei TaxID=2014 RepID=UPI00200FE7E2|nr:conjugal transfer protein [Nocardiopsis dassonvillei]MCK9871354.1 conjugal transfer protein [Nocardiopsis dassonvillei]